MYRICRTARGWVCTACSTRGRRTDYPRSSFSTVAPTTKTVSYYIKTTAGDDQNRIVKLASELSNNDLDWILTLDAENGTWDMYRKHPTNRNGTVDYACGLNNAYHKNFIKKIIDKTATEKEILTYCYEVYNKRHGAFYGYAKRFNKLHINGKWIPRKEIFKLITP